MKTLHDYLLEAEEQQHRPRTGDVFAFELEDGTLLETYVMDQDDQGDILLDSTDKIYSLLEEWNLIDHNLTEDAHGSDHFMDIVDATNGDVRGIMHELRSSGLHSEIIEFCKWAREQGIADIFDAMKLAKRVGLETDDENEMAYEGYLRASELLSHQDMDEAKYQGREVPLGKPMRGDVKKFKVYVRNPKTGNIKKVNFGHGGTSAKRAGQKTMKIKKSNPARRKSFRARHNCDNPGPRTGARYWSCRAW